MSTPSGDPGYDDSRYVHPSKSLSAWWKPYLVLNITLSLLVVMTLAVVRFFSFRGDSTVTGVNVRFSVLSLGGDFLILIGLLLGTPNFLLFLWLKLSGSRR